MIVAKPQWQSVAIVCTVVSPCIMIIRSPPHSSNPMGDILLEYRVGYDFMIINQIYEVMNLNKTVLSNSRLGRFLFKSLVFCLSFAFIIIGYSKRVLVAVVRLKVAAPKAYLNQRYSSIEGHLSQESCRPFKVVSIDGISHRQYSSTRGRLPSKLYFH